MRLLFSMIMLALVLTSSTVAFAQDSPETPTAESEVADDPVDAKTPAGEKGKPATATEKPPIQSDIETLYLRDKDGELVPILNMTFEDFQRLYRLEKKLIQPNVPPAFTIERMDIVGTAKERRLVELDIKLQVKLIKDGIAQIPLRLQTAILTGPAEYAGEGEHFLNSAGPQGGFVSWLSGTAGSNHEIRLKMVAHSVSVGKQSQLNLSLPRASASQLKMNVPGRGSGVSLGASGKLVNTGKLVRKKPNAAGRRTYTIAGLGDDFQMSWGSSGKKTPSPLLVEAKGDVQVRVNGPGVVSTTARFRIASVGGSLETVKIQLPVNSTPILVEDPNYVTEFAATDPDENGTGSPIALVRFNEPTKGPVEVKLEVEQDKPLTSETDEAMDVMSFKVLDAISHSGSVSLVADGDWLVRWEENTGLRRITGGVESNVAANLIAVFEYYRQPAKLPIRIYQKPTTVSVEPLYVIDVQDNQATLDATLKFRVRGTPASFIRCDLSGWQVTSVGDASLVREDAILMNEVAPLEIPLETARRGDFTLRMTAIKKLELPANSEPDEGTILQLRLPGFLDTTVAPAVVVVNPADNLTLIGNATTNAFDSEPLPPTLSVPPRDRAPLCYLYRGDPTATTLEYNVVRREQSIKVDIANKLDIKGGYARVTQNFEYNVRYESLENVQLDLPPSIADSGSLKILLDDQEVDLDAINKSLPTEATNQEAAKAQPAVGNNGATDILPPPSPGEKVAGDAPLRWDIPLPQPRSGNIKVELSYDLAGSSVASGPDATDAIENRTWNCHFAAPAMGDQRSVTLSVNTPEKFVAELTDASTWTSRAAGGTPVANSLSVAAASQPPTASILVRRGDSEQSRSIVIERAFSQTWLSQSQRQDRTTFQLSAATSPLQVQLPRGADWDAAYALVNGERVEINVENEALSIELPSGRSDNLRLEIAYPFKRRPQTGPIRMEMPAVNGAGWIRSLYWQVVTPDNEHLVWSSGSYALNNRWQVSGFGWKRQPEFSQQQLEEWSGASNQFQPPSDTNSYLFSGFGERAALDLRTASRHFLLFGGAAVVLALFLFWQFAPLAMRSFATIPLLLISVAIAALNPGLAVLLCQAAALGMVLIGIMRVTQWMLPDEYRFSRNDATRPSLSVNQSQAATRLQNPSRSSDSFQVTLPTTE